MLCLWELRLSPETTWSRDSSVPVTGTRHFPHPRRLKLKAVETMGVRFGCTHRLRLSLVGRHLARFRLSRKKAGESPAPSRDHPVEVEGARLHRATWIRPPKELRGWSSSPQPLKRSHSARHPCWRLGYGRVRSDNVWAGWESVIRECQRRTVPLRRGGLRPAHPSHSARARAQTSVDPA